MEARTHKGVELAREVPSFSSNSINWPGFSSEMRLNFSYFKSKAPCTRQSPMCAIVCEFSHTILHIIHEKKLNGDKIPKLWKSF